MASILVIGGGFGGVVAAEELAASGFGHQITLVSPKHHFTFYPALVQLAFGEADPADITFDLASKLTPLGVRFIQGELIRVNPGRRTADIGGGEFNGEISYDYLILAAGRRLATEKVRGLFEHAHHILGVKAARRFSAAVTEFKEGTILLGLCPGARLPVPVCETAFALARRFAPEVKAGSIRIKVVFPGSLRDAFGGAMLHKELESAFERNGINVLYEVPITEALEGEVLSSSGHRIAYDLLMLVPPFRGQAILSTLGITDENDYVKVDGAMRVQGLPRVFAVGDLVAFSGPKLAHMAVRQARVAAANIAAELRGETPSDEYYHEIAAVIDSGGPDSIYLHYGVWDDHLMRLRQGRFWGWAKEVHDAMWRSKHR
jgi:sulfide:quinone oxidoreductase